MTARECHACPEAAGPSGYCLECCRRFGIRYDWPREPHPNALPVAADLFPDLKPGPKPPPPAGTMGDLFD